ncbi:MAG: 3-oxoacyl-ACP reductase family protein [Dehalococcoidia bacterium]
MKLDGRVAIVTGATSGIGRSIALVLASEGAKVAVCGRNMDRGNEVVEQIQQAGGTGMMIQGDIASYRDIDATVDRTIGEWGKIDILVNNAAYLPGTSSGPFHEEDPSDWETHIDITLKGTLYFCRAVIPHMMSRKSGRIINISTVAAKVGQPGGPYLYPGCKAAIVAISRCLASELGRSGISVNCVAPGPTRTGSLLEQPQEFLDKITRGIPLRKMGEPEDIAHMVAFLASDEAGFITGQHYSVDGGISPY